MAFRDQWMKPVTACYDATGEPTDAMPEEGGKPQTVASELNGTQSQLVRALEIVSTILERVRGAEPEVQDKPSPHIAGILEDALQNRMLAKELCSQLDELASHLG